MNYTQNMNMPVIILLLLLAAYTWNLVRSNRINTQLGVGWLIVESMIVLLCLLHWHIVARVLARLGGGDVTLGVALLGLGWLALLILNNHARISKLTAKLKQVNQEMALACERLDRLESQRGAGTAHAADGAKPSAAVASAPAVTAAATIPVFRLGAACVWMVAVAYVFAVYSGLAPPEGAAGEMLTSLFASLKAEYLH